MKVCYPLMQPCLAVPWGQKKPQHVHFSTSRRSNVGAPMAQLTDKSRISSDDNIKPWFKLLGMTLYDLDDGFPETLWDAVGADSPETLKKKVLFHILSVKHLLGKAIHDASMWLFINLVICQCIFGHY
jgi:hypothetical protein